MRTRPLVPIIAGLALILTASSLQPAQADAPVTIVAVGDVAMAKGGQAKTAALTKNLNPQQVNTYGGLGLQEWHRQRIQQILSAQMEKLVAKNLGSSWQS